MGKVHLGIDYEGLEKGTFGATRTTMKPEHYARIAQSLDVTRTANNQRISIDPAQKYTARVKQPSGGMLARNPTMDELRDDMVRLGGSSLRVNQNDDDEVMQRSPRQ